MVSERSVPRSQGSGRWVLARAVAKVWRGQLARERQNSRPGRASTSYQNRPLPQEPRTKHSHLTWERRDLGAKSRVQ